MRKNVLLMLAMIMISIAAMAQAPQAKQVVSTKVADLLKHNKKLVILDVRTPEEFAQGHVKNAININIRDADALAKIDKLDHKATYLVYCRSKNRSGMAVTHMLEKGFANVYHMTDGITGWTQNGLSLDTAK